MVKPQTESRGTRTIFALSIMILFAVVGFSLYRVFTGEAQIGQVFVFIFLGLVAFGLIRAGIFAGDRELNLENFFLLVILIGSPIAILLLLPKVGINLFSTIGPAVGASGSFNIAFALKGSLIDWIKNNLIWVIGGLIGLFIWRNKIANFIKGKR